MPRLGGQRLFIIPVSAGVVVADILVLGQQAVLAKGGLGGDEAVEGVASPDVAQAPRDHLMERYIADPQIEGAA